MAYTEFQLYLSEDRIKVLREAEAGNLRQVATSSVSYYVDEKQLGRMSQDTVWQLWRLGALNQSRERGESPITLTDFGRDVLANATTKYRYGICGHPLLDDVGGDYCREPIPSDPLVDDFPDPCPRVDDHARVREGGIYRKRQRR